ncbi:SDR family oxidoreductase [Sedimentitalea sp. JM2-8]|uniref:SDR family oxidoreductase n=1 Tax=Sedimentitalea xiamensis TaxID=3050037 RepID=A0ABT7FDW2_9RHOB|nr:SDR family oxidoreductase [Sedimentitalea xiamensis]MDK3073306.1 SDR family oxidoreductase [Sedimentitalea xiamensis]
MQAEALFDLRGKIACVTGASSGLGRFAATALAGSGAQVIGVARRAGSLAAWRSETDGDTALVAADLSDRTGLPEVAQRIADVFGPPDILINAAGVNTRQHADAVTPEMWDLTQNLNLAAPFFLAQAMVPGMRAKGWGRIINFASLQSRRAFANGIAYGASKGAVEQLTRAMAEAWSRDGVTANALAPGFFRTELTAPVFADAALARRHANQTCVGRNGEPRDLLGPLLFFCGRASDYVTGQVLFVDGGFTAK